MKSHRLPVIPTVCACATQLFAGAYVGTAQAEQSCNIWVVEDYAAHAAGDDWGPAFNALIADAAASGGTVQLSPRSYLVRTPIVLAGQSVRVRGAARTDGLSGSVLRFEGGGTLEINGATAAQFDGVAFLRTDGAGECVRIAGDTGQEEDFVNFSNCGFYGGAKVLQVVSYSNLRLVQCRFYGQEQTHSVIALEGQSAEECTEVEFLQCDIRAPAGTGAILLSRKGSAGTVQMTQCRFSGGRIGIYSSRRADGNDDRGRVYLSNSDFAAMAGPTVLLECQTAFAIANTSFSHQSAAHPLVHLSSRFAGTLRIDSSDFSGAGREFVRVEGGDMVQITGSQFRCANGRDDAGVSGIFIGRDVGSVAVTGNIFAQPGDDGGVLASWISLEERGDNRIATVGNIYCNAAPSEISIEPRPADIDGDTLPDTWEIKYFGAATVAEPLGDHDKDGSTEIEEFIFATDPTEPNPRAAPVFYAWDVGTHIQIHVAVNPDAETFYHVVPERSADLVSWEDSWDSIEMLDSYETEDGIRFFEYQLPISNPPAAATFFRVRTEVRK